MLSGSGESGYGYRGSDDFTVGIVVLLNILEQSIFLTVGAIDSHVDFGAVLNGLVNLVMESFLIFF